MKYGQLPALLDKERLDDSLLLGFYGGGNYGDELLMETLAGLLKQRGASNISIAYQTPESYHDFHHDFGYPRVAMRSKLQLFKAIAAKKNIVIGGGGLWGMDANLNILLMSFMLFAARFLLGKKIYLLGVGYYHSAPIIGRISAWLAAKAATAIIARDEETYQNFKRLQPHTTRDVDMAWYIHALDLNAYTADLTKLQKRLPVHQKTLFITLRRFRGSTGDRLAALVEECIAKNSDKPIIVALMEPRGVDPEGYHLLQSWQQRYSNVRTIDFCFNPLALFLFFRAYHTKLTYIGPQFHGILSAHLTGVPYLPLAYDNKVQGLLKHIAPQRPPIAVQSLRLLDVQTFIDGVYGVST
ncbi:MAG TPA: polysaccharide pyruvyl transferase family protein [Candidatus Saccharimonadales bacterium]|nr:polysaccharide pyruvyl transferase family protein [Candidatus Saccharimonadales bacterium]